MLANLGAAKTFLRFLAILGAVYLAIVLIVYILQRSLIYFPSHSPVVSDLAPWKDGDRMIGCCREVKDPKAIWLMTHGNAGQAADRGYVLQCIPEQDSLYVLEYPGYGMRPGSPSMGSMNAAASEAYRILRSRFPDKPLCVLGESIGSGPAASLAREPMPPDKIVLVVPFDRLANVAARQFPFLPVRLLLRDNWDNATSLAGYRGPVEILGASNDKVIPFAFAEALAKSIPQARLAEIGGGHNDWCDFVRITR